MSSATSANGMSLETHQTLVYNLLEQHQQAGIEDPCERVETHISSVLICGDNVYKIKKPVDFGFLDFSTLEARRHFCEEEIRLNRRLAPAIYLGTVAITGSLDQPRLGGDGAILEWAVRMRRFDQQNQFDRLLQQDRLDAPLMHRLARRMADFHASVETATTASDFGRPRQVLAPMLENFNQIRDHAALLDDSDSLQRLEEWTRQRFDDLRQLLDSRRRHGFIRECHGDMHLANIALDDGQVLIFDGIEFNANLRWIDVFSELAFTSMDLAANGRTDLASQLVNRYLEHSGDYAGLPLLDFYQLYRAMVRAKVIALGSNGDNDGAARRLFSRYLELGRHFIRPAAARLILVAGFSATGKSTLSEQLLTDTRTIRLRSDRERKRLFDQQAEGGRNSLNSGLYSEENTRRTYEHLLELASLLLRQGFNVLIDATLLKRAQRQPFQQLAAELSVPSWLIWLDAPTAVLVARMQARRQSADNISDADEQVIGYQKRTAEIPDNHENVVTIDTSGEFDYPGIRQQLGLQPPQTTAISD